MKKVFNQINFLLLAAAIAVPAVAFSQDDKDKEAKEKKEAEQIIITRKGDSGKKVVIEVIGDKILVDGKEVKESDKDGDIIVRRHKIKDVWAFGGDGLTTTLQNYGRNFRMFDMSENRAMLGVTTEQAEGGAEVQTVSEGSAAEKAGLKKGDIIRAIDDTKIETPDDLSEAIREHKPGDKVSISITREKKEQKITAELGKWKGVSAFGYTPGQNFDFDFEKIAPRIQAVPHVAPGQNWSWSGGGPKLGISVQDTEDGKGVSVIDVDEDGNAAKAGIKEDDVITEVDGKAVNSADEIARLMRSSKDKSSVKVKLLRKGKTETVDVKIPRKLKKADL